jgi:hypothetical protein
MRTAACAAALTVLVMLAHTLTTGRARADDPLENPPFSLPPPPARAGTRLAIEVHTGYTFPLDQSALCPRAFGCVLQGGGGIGTTLERRWPSGFGLFAGYDAWFLDSDSVYELAVQQMLRAGLRFTEPTDYVFHPVFELSLGGMGLGDVFRIATVGVLGQAFAGGEIELTETFGVRLGVGARAFSHSSFRTKRDGVQRGSDRLFSEAFFFELGLTVM